jgi:hypothetical protein
MEGEQMADNRRSFLDIPTEQGIRIAIRIILASMMLGGAMYYFANKGVSDYVAKVGDCLIQGAIIGIIFALFKGMIDKAKWGQSLRFWRGEPGPERAISGGSSAVAHGPPAST